MTQRIRTINHKKWYICTIMVVFLMVFFSPTIVRAQMKKVQLARSFSFTTLNGKTITGRTYKTMATVLIFGRSSCSYSRSMLDQSEYIRSTGKSVKTIFIGIDSYDSGLYSLAKQYPNAVFVKTSQMNGTTLWSLLRSVGYNSHKVTLPGTFILDKYHNIAYYTTGNDTTSLVSTLRFGDFSTKLSLKSDSIYLSQIDCPVTGKAIKPEVTVYYGSALLKKGRDYTLTYSNNVKIGTAKVLIKGKGGFRGRIVKKYQIVKNGLSKGTIFKEGGASYKVIKGGKSGKIKVAYMKAPNSGFVQIPSRVTYKGNSCKVTLVAKNALKGNANVQTVIIGENVTSIGSGALSNCLSLNYVYVSPSVKMIGKKAFYNCPSLATIYIATKHLTSKNVGVDAFSGVGKNTTPTISIISASFNQYKKWIFRKGLSQSAILKSY